MSAEEVIRSIFQPIMNWLVENGKILLASALVSTTVSGVIGYYSKRRLVTRAERREHLREIRSDVLQPMLTKLESYKSKIQANVQRYEAPIPGFQAPMPIEPVRPTESRFYDTLPQHFPTPSLSYNNLQAKIREFGDKCVLFLNDLRQALEVVSGLTIRDSWDPLIEGPFIRPEGLSYLYRSFFSENLRTRSDEYLQPVEEYQDQSKLLIGNTEIALGSLEVIKKCRGIFLSLITDAKFAERGRELERAKDQLLKTIEDVKGSARRPCSKCLGGQVPLLSANSAVR